VNLIDYIKDVRHVEEEIFDAIKASPAPVVLWGAGEIAWCVWTYLCQHGIEPVCFCDNNPAKQGTVHLGLPVYGYDDFKKKSPQYGNKYHIVVATGIQYKEPIFSQLASANEKNPVWYLCGFEICGEKINYHYICEHIHQFEEAYASLTDNFSKKVFINVLNAKISGNFNLYKEIMSHTEYFDEDVVHLSENEVFLDVGAYQGNAIIEFVKRTKEKYDGIIAFEPDKKTLSVLQATIKKNVIQKVELHNKGAWDKHEVMHFHDGREGGSRIAESVAAAFPANSIEVDAIDNILHGRRVTYISMDIEGAEHNAILGAEQTIKKWKPKMAVCVYHKREDLFDLLLLLKSFVPKYKFYMRHYTNNQTETVLYAV
jgi:FkbM family methyltransferase